MPKATLKKTLGAGFTAILLASCAPGDEAKGPEGEQAQAPAALTEERTTEDVLATLQASMARAQSTNGAGAPALWTLKDEDTTIHMFGTVHILRPETVWRTPAFEAAFSAADKLVLEADTSSPEAQASMGALLLKLAQFDDGQTLNDVIDDADEPIVEAALGTFNIPMSALQPMKPWFVSLQMSVMQMMGAGFDPESGVEPILTAEATAAGKSFGYLETAEDQFNVLAGGAMEDQVEGLLFTAQTLEFGPQILDAIVSEWADGDVAGLGEIMAEPDAIGGVEAYQALLVNRNRNWVPQIKAMLDTPGTVFVAVGSAHFAGPDSVITMLRDDGLDISGPQ